MIKFISLSLKNFLSYGNNFTNVNLDFTEPTLILGKNLDSSVDGAVDSNGSGKTTILHAITYSLYDNTIEDIDKNNLINNINKKNMEVELIFEKDGIQYKIVRYRKNSARGGDGVLFLVNQDGEFKDKTKSSVAETNAFITSIIGIPFEVFTRIVAISATHDPFLSLPASHTSKANQRDFLENLFGYTEISEKAESLKEKIKNTTADMKLQMGILEEVKQAESRYNEQIQSLKTKSILWHNNQQHKIKDIKIFLESHDIKHYTDLLDEVNTLSLLQTERNSISSQIEFIRKSSVDVENNNIKYYKWIEDNKDKQEQISNFLKNVNEELITNKIELCNILDTNLKDITTLENEIKDISSQKSVITKKLEENNKEISHLVVSKCPYCLQKYETAGLKVDELELKNIELASTIKNFESSITNLSTKISKLQSKNKKLKEFLGQDTVTTLHKQLNDFKNNKEQLEILLKQENPYTLTTKSKNSFDDESILKQKMDSIICEIANIQAKLNGMSKQTLDTIILQIKTSQNELKSLVSAENPYEQAIIELESNPPKSGDYSKIEELNSEIEHQNFLYKLLTKKDSFIRKTLLNKNIPFLNTRLQVYLKKMGLPHQVQFTDDMSAEIRQFGTVINYGNLSAGQKARINLALSFAFRDVLQARHGKISFCILDECLDVGLGSLGVTQAVKMIKSVAVENKLPMLVISHRDEVVNMFSKTINVELKNGFSTLIQ